MNVVGVTCMDILLGFKWYFTSPYGFHHEVQRYSPKSIGYKNDNSLPERASMRLPDLIVEETRTQIFQIPKH